jgi:hypothetical protein
MVTHKDIRLRQAILFEYRSGNNKNQSLVNIREKFGTDSVSLSTICDWYERFRLQMSSISLFDQNTPQDRLTPVIQKLPNGDEVRKLVLFSLSKSIF